MSPLLDLAKIKLFGDDSYVLEWKKHRGELINAMTAELAVIIKWFKDSWLKVNESKMDLCLYHRRDSCKLKSKSMVTGLQVKVA